MPRTVLIVDDHPGFRRAARALLEAEGYLVVGESATGVEALAAVDRFHPELVLLDVGLPDMNGYEVARQIRAADNGSHPTIITLSGYGQPEDRRQSDQAGCDDHLVKPVDPDALRDLFRRASSAIPSV